MSLGAVNDNVKEIANIEAREQKAHREAFYNQVEAS
jgi:hypothetical protein